MPRKGPAIRKPLVPDPIYQSVLVTQLINKILLSGKKSLAESIVYKSLEHISERTAKFHVTSILNKLGAENRARAVAIAAERHLL